MGNERFYNYEEFADKPTLVKVLAIAGIVVAALIVLWGIYAIIISIDFPLSEGYVVKKVEEPFEIRYVTRSTDHDITISIPDGNGGTTTTTIHDYTEYKKYKIYDYEDYIITITDGKEREKNYIFFKLKNTVETKFYVEKQTYDFLHIESRFSDKEYKCSWFDFNNREELVSTWRN
jgi:hypothetical protein